MGTAFDKERPSRLRDVMAGCDERGEVPGVVALLARRDFWTLAY